MDKLIERLDTLLLQLMGPNGFLAGLGLVKETPVDAKIAPWSDWPMPPLMPDYETPDVEAPWANWPPPPSYDFTGWAPAPAPGTLPTSTAPSSSGTPTSGGVGGGVWQITVPVSIEGREVARAVAKFLPRELAAQGY
jgi:hypothetical protein